MKYLILTILILASCTYEVDVPIPETINVEMEDPYYTECVEFKLCAPEGAYIHKARDYCVACMQCQDGLWREIWCGDFPWRDDINGEID